MEESTSKEKVLKRIRNALITKTNNPFPLVDFDSPVFATIDDSLDIAFAQEFIKVSGKFVYCENENELLEDLRFVLIEYKDKPIFCKEEHIKNFLTKGEIPFITEEEEFLNTYIGITGCEYLIARLGSIMVSSRQQSGRRLNVYPEIHIVIAYTSQLVPDLKQAFQGIKAKYGDKLPSMISVITGPSRTADIEKTLVMGAHGPREVFVFMVENQQ
jgi:L-lactate dehydrogenase complex protein LldG